MTKQELIEKIAPFPDDAPVKFFYDGGHDHLDINQATYLEAAKGHTRAQAHILLAEEDADELTRLLAR